ncbi:Luminescence regulatory protein LuxO [Hartmannibacter diazotrophicus]|uniref:Luminescence regulatory protein LuxO n=1 Tax=Hartmannibacter diazotrophicus TaxID=1482074 RepID=A0A2C9D2Q7_9HYPH|nr:sigma 54-interacting transcriptional regulator [Hartmannibacter diazotrophicus]SON54617.1 Luminescence regulatory protein LuxO [Hartmannibacter diazotrophicus]
MGVSIRPSSALRVLLVDSDPEARNILKRALEQRIARPLMILETASPETARLMLAEQNFDVLTLDLDTIGGPSGYPEFHTLARSSLTYVCGEASRVIEAVAVVRAGAADYVEKPLDGTAFARRIERQFVVAEAITVAECNGLVGRSARMRTLFDQIARVAPASAPVFISGETGTGKELCARAIHSKSRRREGPFVVVDCASLGRDDLMMALAGSDGTGALFRANGGSLLLDEVGGLDPAVQAMLVRFIESGEVVGLNGEVLPQRLDVRLLATTEHLPEALIQTGTMRADLFYRLNVLTMRLPALRERPEDIGPIAEAVLKRCAEQGGTAFSRFAPSAEKAISSYAWPGNVRELENLIHRIAMLNDGEVITAEMLSNAGLGLHRTSTTASITPIRSGATGEVAEKAQTPAAARVKPLWMTEAEVIEEAIEAFDGNIARAAAALEISPSTIYRKRRSVAQSAKDLLPQVRFG